MSYEKYHQEDIAYKYDQKTRNIAELLYGLCFRVAPSSGINKKALEELQGDILTYQKSLCHTDYDFTQEVETIKSASEEENIKSSVLKIKEKADKILREIIYTSEKFLDTPPPDVVFANCKFVLTGCFLLVGSKDEAVRLINERGGIIKSSRDKLTLDTDYLVVGVGASRHYKFENYGTKLNDIAKIKEHERAKLKVISEAHFLKFIS